MQWCLCCSFEALPQSGHLLELGWGQRLGPLWCCHCPPQRPLQRIGAKTPDRAAEASTSPCVFGEDNGCKSMLRTSYDAYKNSTLIYSLDIQALDQNYNTSNSKLASHGQGGPESPLICSPVPCHSQDQDASRELKS